MECPVESNQIISQMVVRDVVAVKTVFALTLIIGMLSRRARLSHCKTCFPPAAALSSIVLPVSSEGCAGDGHRAGKSCNRLILLILVQTKVRKATGRTNSLALFCRFHPNLPAGRQGLRRRHIAVNYGT